MGGECGDSCALLGCDRVTAAGVLQVAMRRRAAGKRDGVMPGETVPYIICVRTNSSDTAATATPQQQQQQQSPEAAATTPAITPSPQQEQQGVQLQESPAAAGGDTAAATTAAAAGSSSPAPSPAAAGGGMLAVTTAGGSSAAAAAGVGVGGGGGKGKGSSGGGSIAERAFHPDELRSDSSLVIDGEYYLAQQVLPVVVRLCAPIEVSWGGGGTHGRHGDGITLSV